MTQADELAITEPASGTMGVLDGDKITLVSVVVVAAVAIVALVLAAVSLSQGPAQVTINGGLAGTAAGGSGASAGALVSGGDPKSKIWTFAIGHDFSPYEYQNSQGYTDGFNVELLSAICQEAGVTCHLVYDDYNNCWNGNPGKHPIPGQGLLGRWYDACTGWTTQASRLNSVKFSKPWSKVARAKFLVPNNNPRGFDPRNVSGKKIGFLDGWVNDEHCVARQTTVSGNVLAANQIKHYKKLDDAYNGLANGEIDALFHSTDANIDTGRFQFVGNDADFKPCMISGLGMMLRKDSILPTWFDPALERVKEQGIYARICKEAPKKHAKNEEKVQCLD